MSPDGQFRAIVQPSGKDGKESRIEVLSSNGHIIFKQDFGSSDGEHGKAVVQAGWTPDSKFFVWNMENSGGHSPWHWPIYYFSRHLKSSRSLDKIVGGISSSSFSLEAPNTVKGTRLDRKNSRPIPFSVKLVDQDK